MTATCETHAAPATHRCDGCGRLLCEECFEVGHRLLFCRHCGERALPLEEQGPENALELARVRRRGGTYTPREVLTYPLRGRGGYVFLASVVVVGGFLVMNALSGMLGLLALILSLILLVLVPGMSFAIVRATAQGSDELPDWPEWQEGERLGEIGAMVSLGLLTLVPAVILVSISGCAARLLVVEPMCVLLTGLGLVLGLLVSVPALAATAGYANNWLSVRWDLHLRAFVRTWRDSARIALALTALHLVGAALGWALSFLPLLGGLLRLTIYVYAWFLGMHLIGLLLRRHEEAFEAIYYD